MIRNVTQIRQRLLRRTHLLFNLAQLVGKLNHEVTVALALMRRERHNARQIVPQLATLLLAKVANHVVALVVVLRYHVKVERSHVVVKRFVVQKELRYVRNVLRVHTLVVVAISVHLKDGNVVLAVDLVSRRTLHVIFPTESNKKGTLLHVSMKLAICQEKAQAVLADEELYRTCKETQTQSV